MPTDVIVSFVTFSSQELEPRLNERWPFLKLQDSKVFIKTEAIARLVKRGANVRLTPTDDREIVRWLGWAIQDICPGAEAADEALQDEEGAPARILEAPLSDEDVEKAAEKVVADRMAALANEADPNGGALEAARLITYLINHELLEMSGPVVAAVRAIFPLLQNVKDDIGDKLDDALLDLDEVEELFAEPEQLTKIVMNNEHIFDH